MRFLPAWIAVYGIPLFWIGRQKSLRWDWRAIDAVRTAQLLGIDVPGHPSWWKDGKNCWRGAGRPLILLAAVAGSVAFYPVLTEDYERWPWPETFQLILSAILLSPFYLLWTFRQDRRSTFAKTVRREVVAASPLAVQNSRDTLQTEVDQLISRLTNLKADLDAYGPDALRASQHEEVRNLLSDITAGQAKSDRRAWFFFVGGVVAGWLLNLLAGS